MYAVVGLGNPGKEYENTRHNIGFDTVELLAQRNNININKIKFKAVYGEGQIGNQKIILIKPQTYMNNSGMSVLELYKFYKIPIEKIIVVVDDIDIQFGTIRIKRKGSAGTHNGMKSIIYHLQNDDFPRVKVGIGSPKPGQDLAQFVLSRFSKEERQTIDHTIELACEAIETTINKDLNNAMNIYNSKDTKAQE
ncbi:aminoacyl-tRNA hydrolase [Sporanaerobacter acetigenes]|uniref:Peptidyl-tRNA hydrolase n=1 Tax=Sporanaerobacter acetigenes DSM 13106 TaxID=1123281 RepID=A0A1M5Y641_9FIRM|nr:aminoacyl-tRNA hydrolase [Sporanaerobacter acetigenes]SHI07298.1 peptidyl-tRNA hydrolase, PTH1 family [Sporanaerobacter acetigenes DSM 13106]